MAVPHRGFSEFLDKHDMTNWLSRAKQAMASMGETSTAEPQRRTDRKAASGDTPLTEVVIKSVRKACKNIIDAGLFQARLSPEDISGIHAGRLTAEHLRSFAEMMAERLTRERGEVPEGWTATTCCRHCGGVAIWPGCPNEVLGCPWCHRP